jgi:hypothetical protein
MAQGKKTGGRKPGGLNKRTLALEAKAKEAAQKIETALGGKAFDGDSHALLMAVYKNVDYPMELRMDAAKAAIRFEKPALSSVDGKGNLVPNYIAYLPQGCATPEEWLDQFGHLKGQETEPTKQ